MPETEEHVTASSLVALLQGRVPRQQAEPILRHLKECRRCRSLPASLLRSSPGALGGLQGVDYDEAINRAIRKTLRNKSRLSRSRDFDPGVSLVEQLLAQSYALRHSDPQRMVELAELAEKALSQV